jgi:hypothetical protein
MCPPVLRENDRRQAERFVCPETHYRVVDSACGQELGYLMDISIGGLAFFYYQDNGVHEESGSIDLVSDTSGPILTSVAYENVTDFDILGNYPFNLRHRRRRGVRFSSLSTEKLVDLKQFIQLLLV